MSAAGPPSTLQRLEIREACESLALDYAFHADAGNWERWSELFAEDGEMHLSGVVLKGPEAIQRAVSGGPTTRQTVHAISNHRVEVVSAEEARGSAYVTVYIADRVAGAPAEVERVAPLIVGVYRDNYRRTAAGWKFHERRFEPLISAARS